MLYGLQHKMYDRESHSKNPRCADSRRWKTQAVQFSTPARCLGFYRGRRPKLPAEVALLKADSRKCDTRTNRPKLAIAAAVEVVIFHQPVQSSARQLGFQRCQSDVAVMPG